LILSPAYTGYGGGWTPIVIAVYFLYGGRYSGVITGKGGNLGSYRSRFLKQS